MHVVGGTHNVTVCSIRRPRQQSLKTPPSGRKARVSKRAAEAHEQLRAESSCLDPTQFAYSPDLCPGVPFYKVTAASGAWGANSWPRVDTCHWPAAVFPTGVHGANIGQGTG